MAAWQWNAAKKMLQVTTPVAAYAAVVTQGRRRGDCLSWLCLHIERLKRPCQHHFSSCLHDVNQVSGNPCGKGMVFFQYGSEHSDCQPSLNFPAAYTVNDTESTPLTRNIFLAALRR